MSNGKSTTSNLYIHSLGIATCPDLSTATAHNHERAEDNVINHVTPCSQGHDRGAHTENSRGPFPFDHVRFSA